MKNAMPTKKKCKFLSIHPMRNPIISYMILAPNEMQAEPDERKSAKVCLETIQLDPELYRIGHTKARSNKLEPKDIQSLHKSNAASFLLPHRSLLFFIQTISQKSSGKVVIYLIQTTARHVMV